MRLVVIVVIVAVVIVVVVRVIVVMSISAVHDQVLRLGARAVAGSSPLVQGKLGGRDPRAQHPLGAHLVARDRKASESVLQFLERQARIEQRAE